MRRRISSRLTWFQKFVFPTVWIGGFSIGTVALFVRAIFDPGPKSPPIFVCFIFLATLLFGGTKLYRQCAPLKRIILTDGELLISNFRNEIAVPLMELESVTEDRSLRSLGSLRSLTLHFKHETRFGTSATFIPRQSFLALFRPRHPVLQELLDARDAARQLAHLT